MEDTLAGQLRHLMSVRSLEWSKTADVQRLEKVARMSRHTEADNLVLYTIAIELRRSVATVAVQDKQSIGARGTRRCVLIEVL
jgi:hypothetical protein